MRRIAILDYARFFAAVSILISHYFFLGPLYGKIFLVDYPFSSQDIFKYAYLGVEFFFMISGYVIFYSARHRSASEFAYARMLRLFPAYWVAVLLTASVAAFWGGPHMRVFNWQVIANLTMLNGF